MKNKKNQLMMDSFIKHTMKATRTYAFVSMNIKDFKGINLRFGSTFGDYILQRTSSILEHVLSSNEGYYHAYGDIFELWVVSDEEHPIEERLCNIDDMLYHLSDERVHQSIFLSFGIYMPHAHDQYLHMRDCANFCRSHSIDSTKLNTHIEVYNEEMKKDYIRKQEVALALRKGFARNDFYVLLQPKVSLLNKQILGAEALFRCRDTSLADLSIQELILVSEQNGFVRELDLYMFEQVCILLQRWIDTYRSYIKISVNVSRYHFENPLFFQAYLDIFQKYFIPAEAIEFEITETAISSDLKSIRYVVQQMHTNGFCIALDDFGNGNSSFSDIKELPISTLKLDRSLFLNENDESRIIVKSILSMARQLCISTVCEGIETKEQEAFLLQCGANFIQGYIYYPPLSINEIEDLVFHQ